MSINQDLAETKLKERVGIIVYLKTISDQYKLRRLGDVVYFSKKFSYCVLYVNKAKAEDTISEINKFNFVEKVMLSQNDQINLGSEHIESQITALAKEAEVKLANMNERDLL